MEPRDTLTEEQVRDVVEVAQALKEPADFGPPHTMRGTARPCNEHGHPHWHWEAVARLPGGIIAHYFDPEPYRSERVALAVLRAFARQGGREDISILSHEEFDHSMRPEVEQMGQEEAHHDL
jgi:hypothetical protein